MDWTDLADWHTDTADIAQQRPLEDPVVTEGPIVPDDAPITDPDEGP